MASKRPLTPATTLGGRDAQRSVKCDNCDIPFKPKKSDQKYCSVPCRRIARRLNRSGSQVNTHCLNPACGKELVGKRRHAQYCGSTCRRVVWEINHSTQNTSETS